MNLLFRIVVLVGLIAGGGVAIGWTGQSLQVSARQDINAELVVCPTCKVTSIVQAIATVPEGSVIEVRGGTYPGELAIDRSVSLIATEGATVDGNEEGTLIRITATDVTIDGFRLQGTGSSHDKEDSAIVVDAERTTIINNHIEDALFGIYLRTSHGSIVRNNEIIARPVDQALRGDGIRIWYSNDVIVDSNIAVDGRDIILWYSNDAQMINNRFDGNRYGMHLMYSDGADISNNSLNDNTIGLYIMYSRDPLVVGNSLSNNKGASGGGLGLKDVDGAHVEANRFVNNQIGAQVDTSPREPNIENYFIGNVFAFNEVGIGFQPAVRHNTLIDNAFIDNGDHVALLGRGKLKDITWAVDGSGNYWSDYAGYDDGGDGVGDLPYQSQRMFEALVSDYPDLRIFSYSPASMAIDFAAEAFPSVRPEIRFEDPAPLMSPVQSDLLPPVESSDPTKRFLLAIAGGLIGVVALIGVRKLRRQQVWDTGSGGQA